MTDPTAAWPPPRPPDCNAALVLADGTVFWGRGIGATGQAVGEVCFNTSITGYQEILTDPSYAGADHHLHLSAYRQCRRQSRGHRSDDPGGARPRDPQLRSPSRPITAPRSRSMPGSNRIGIVGLSGVDTRRLTRLHPRHGAAERGHRLPPGRAARPRRDARGGARLGPVSKAWISRKEVTCRQSYEWAETVWRPRARLRPPGDAAVSRRRGRLRRQAQHPAHARRAWLPGHGGAGRPPRREEIMRHRPDGIFLSNGPGDPAATGEYAVPVLRELIDIGQADVRHLPRPSAAGAGARRHDPQDATRPSRRQPPGPGRLTGKVEITSQNHGFVVDPDSLPDGVERDAHLAVRPHQRGAADERPAGLFGAAPPRSQPRPAGQPLSVPAVHRLDGGEGGGNELGLAPPSIDSPGESRDPSSAARGLRAHYRASHPALRRGSLLSRADAWHACLSAPTSTAS